MAVVGVLFEVQCARTVPGESVCVVGDRPELGNWLVTAETCASVQLRTNCSIYPRWTNLSPVWLELSEEEVAKREISVKYKYVVGSICSESTVACDLKWESSISDRVMMLPTLDNSVWLVIDSHWDFTATHSLCCMTWREVRGRWSRFVSERGGEWPGRGPPTLLTFWSTPAETSEGDSEGDDDFCWSQSLLPPQSALAPAPAAGLELPGGAACSMGRFEPSAQDLEPQGPQGKKRIDSANTTASDPDSNSNSHSPAADDTPTCISRRGCDARRSAARHGVQEAEWRPSNMAVAISMC